MKASIVHTIQLIAKTMHASHLKADYTLQDRPVFLKYIKVGVGPVNHRELCAQEYLASEPADTVTSVLRVMCANACAHLAYVYTMCQPRTPCVQCT